MTITYDDLKQCAFMAREADRLREQMLRVRAKVEGGGLRVVVKVTGKGDADPVGTAVSDLDELRVRWQGVIDRYLSLANHIDEVISGVDSPAQRVILRLRYVDGKRWGYICKQTNYSYSWARELRNRGLKAIL